MISKILSEEASCEPPLYDYRCATFDAYEASCEPPLYDYRCATFDAYYYSKDELVIWLNYTKTPLGDEKAEIEKIVIDTIKKNREQGSSVLCNVPARTF